MRIQTKKKFHHLIIFGSIIILLSIFNFSNLYFDSLIHNDANNIHKDDFNLENTLNGQDLSFNNIYEGIGAPWNLTHFANRTDSALQVSFTEGDYDMVDIPLGSGWKGYKMSTEIEGLVDKRNWNNGTFNYGADDGTANAGENDTTWIHNNYQNWVFKNNDTGLGTNPMSGNYLSNIGGQDCLELRMNGDNTYIPPWYTYDPSDKCWWSSSIQIPRGKMIDSSIKFDLYPNHLAQFNSWAFSIYLNSKRVYSIGTYTLLQYGVNAWHSFTIPQKIWTNSSNIFLNEPLNNSVLDINLVLECVGGGNFSGFANEDYQRIYVDNVELIAKAEVLPSYIELNMNQTVVQDIDWGSGNVEIEGDWESTKIFANFSSTDVGKLGNYDINLRCNLNLYGTKNDPETNYETNTDSLGTIFSVNNASSVNWESYGFIAIPTGYSESEMLLDFPTDIVITAVFEPENPSINILSLCDNSIPGRLLIPVDIISANPDGFWKFEAISPNYCEDSTIYNNATGAWIQNTYFLSGDYINITAKITNSPEVSSYLQYSKAFLQIRFPNGTLWSDHGQFAPVDSNGNVYFNPFQIPSIPPNYEVGKYEAIITWNNSFSLYGMNETGIIYKEFNVRHNSELIPDIRFYENVIDGSVLNLGISFKDLENFNAIENAIIFTHNFTHPSIIQYFNEINPGYYFLEFNVTGAPNAGNNTLMIYANSPAFVSSETNITISIIKNTILTVDNDYFTDIPFEQNFTVQFNYTERYNGMGIETINLSTNWAGEYHFVMVNQGAYTLTCNASGSGYQPNTLYSMIILVKANMYQPQSIPIRIYITEKATFLELFINSTEKYEDDLVSIEFWQKLNITVTFKDASSNHLGGATLKLIGGGLSESFMENSILGQYNILLNASDLGLGIDYISIFANLTNYNPKSIRFITEVTERRTLLDLYLNGINMTIDPSTDIAIGKLLNITVKYTDLSGNHIEDATVTLFGAISHILTEDKTLKQYSYIFNTSILDIGIRIITISAEKENYIFQTNDLRINIRRIYTNITTEDEISKISAHPGDAVTIRVVLYNLDFGGTIKGAIVSYTGTLGQGFLVDPDKDGIYEKIFENFPEGTFKIIITAFYGDNYEFENYEITVSAIRPAEEALLILIMIIAITSAAIIIGGYIYAYQKYLKYPKPIRKVRKYSKTLGIKKDPKTDIKEREKAFNVEYQNELNKTSKLLKGKTVEQVAKPELITKKPIESTKS